MALDNVVCNAHGAPAILSGLRFMDTPSTDARLDMYVSASTTDVPLRRVTESPALLNPSCPVDAASAVTPTGIPLWPPKTTSVAPAANRVPGAN